jgi:WD40 repeat protein
VLSAAFSTRENFVFLTGGADRIVKVWDMKTQTPVVSFDQSEGPVVGLCALPGGNQFAGASQDGRILFWQVYYNEKRMQWGGSLTRQVRAHEYGVWNLSISKNGQRMITCGADDHVKVWEVGSMRQVADFAEPLQPTYAVALSPDGRTAAMGGKDGLVRICDAEKKNLLQEITPPQPPPLPMPKPQLMTPAKPLKPSPQKPLPRRKP